MPVIALCGPNAVGKTTAARRWAARYPRLVACLCDVRGLIQEGIETKDSHCWKKHRGLLAERYRALAQSRVVLVESASGYGLRIAQDVEAQHWIVLVCSWQASLVQRKARCARTGKVFKEKAWTPTRLGYESERRMLNAVSGLPPVRYKVFRVEDQSQDWEVVDEYFCALYRKLHNELVTRAKRW